MNACRVFLAVALAAAAAPVGAYTCYAVIDRNDVTIYQSQQPPIDLTDPGAAGMAARNALRARGQLLLVFDSTRCVERTQITTTGQTYASVDEIVMGYKDSVFRRSAGAVNTTGIFGVAGDNNVNYGNGGYGVGNYGGGYGGGYGYGDTWGGGYAGDRLGDRLGDRVGDGGVGIDRGGVGAVGRGMGGGRR